MQVHQFSVRSLDIAGAVEVGFEPTEGRTPTGFEACALSHH